MLSSYLLRLGSHLRNGTCFRRAQHHHHHQPNGAVTAAADGTLTSLTDLAGALDQASIATKLLSASSSSAAPSAVASLRRAHQMLGSFLARLEVLPAPAGNGDEPMADPQVEREEGGDGLRVVGEVEEGLRECILQSKRRKRRVSPSWPPGSFAGGGGEEECSSAADPVDRRQSALDLVLQFHA